MSAIFGILRGDGCAVSTETLRLMHEAAATRGPDGVGFWCDGSVGLGHASLLTIPEPHSALPAVQNDGRLVLTFDGRIDNRAARKGTIRFRQIMLLVATAVEALSVARLA